jgi:hypothetical protein
LQGFASPRGSHGLLGAFLRIVGLSTMGNDCFLLLFASISDCQRCMASSVQAWNIIRFSSDSRHIAAAQLPNGDHHGCRNIHSCLSSALPCQFCSRASRPLHHSLTQPLVISSRGDRCALRVVRRNPLERSSRAVCFRTNRLLFPSPFSTNDRQTHKS